jgi:predicted dehydrogenase
MPARVGVGIIGLGRRWRRYRPALAALRDRLAVRAVCDQRPIRAERAARELGCHAAAGPTDLLDRDDVDAALLLDAQWFGLWPVEQAARVGKPVFCAVPISRDDAHADEVMRRVRDAGLPAMAAMGPSLCPAVTRLRELLATKLGPPRLVRCGGCGPGRGRPDGAVLPALMHACAALMGGEPAGVRAVAAADARIVSGWMDFPGGRVVQLSVWDGTRPACRI